MKKIFLYILAGSLCFSACKKDDDVERYVEPEDIATQNNYDDQAIRKFMDENYLDVQGNIKAFSATDTADDHQKKLSELNPQTLPSGTIYIMRDGAQPSPGEEIKESDIIKIMGRSYACLAGESNGNVSFIAQTTFLNTIDGNVVPYVDPMYYYVKKKTLTDATTDAAKQPGYYQISGFREALQKFKAFNLPSDAPYNLQGVIIVPSRAAFARNAHYPYLNQSYRNRTFIFNFQIYGRADRPADQKQ
ncbi:hypothetical protein V2E39_21150 [Chryseobacterium arthrosphaerae]|uniref:Uncharacterized protein n=1 Tax=Chryseobacterium arthrosphaerae TaxID=651561 RepID=A0A1B8ZF20_9FLAO|nr:MULTISPECIES: hypothetical protein [Chryseobacterium]MDG4653026.1 hypothetical protein [Chryseobacterium arthrosphaerae]OCA70126.1 hypothetical protein BBI00_19975 [Chryseobacterium arthrosphaerae]QUY56145.1 hypothetical protein I2F65_01960 [Chryseobacterium arthrosphaerae]UEQ76022.1 hypothetical protein J8N07_20700 [Chryseobacterium arthrosphaerae]WES97354.1 hypothetical protein P2W68_21380 [Chryseobacterium arthrosphaerae]